MQTRFRILLAATILSVSAAAHAGITVQMSTVDEKGTGKSVGQVVISETPYGVVFSPSLAGLP
jgi:superoxide dismutase, Cu-Zn family